MRRGTPEAKKLDPEMADARTMPAVRLLPSALVLAALAGALAWFLGPARGATETLVYVSGLKVEGEKPVCFVRLTNTSPNAADIFLVHYTIRETSRGIAISEPGAGIGAQLVPGKSLTIDLGKVVTAYRRAHEVGPYTGTVQFVAFAEGGAFRTFSPDTIHVESTQIEGASTRDGVVQWFNQ
jgi:hypothetical protein